VVVVEASADVETSKHAEITADAVTSTDEETSTIASTSVDVVTLAASTITVLSTILVTCRHELTRALLSRLLFLGLASSFQGFHDFDHWHDS
jgi:hypothetical protein